MGSLTYRNRPAAERHAHSRRAGKAARRPTRADIHRIRTTLFTEDDEKTLVVAHDIAVCLRRPGRFQDVLVKMTWSNQG